MDTVSALTRRVNRGRASKREAGGQKTVRNVKEARRGVSPKSCQLTDIILIKYFAFVVEGCDYYTEPDTVLLFRRLL